MLALISLILLIFISIFIYKYKHIIKIYYLYLTSKNIRNDITIDKGVATIEYYRSGIKHVIRVPFKSGDRFKKASFNLIKDGLEIDITHMAGIPYFVNAEQLGGDAIVRRYISIDNTEMVNFSKGEIPYL